MSPAGSALAQPIALGDSPLSLPRPAIVILWGSWCVSCRAELRRLGALTEPASPLPIATLAIDPPDSARRVLNEMGLSRATAFADPRPATLVLSEWGGADAGLPLAVAIDASGKVCGRKRGLLGTDQLRAWAKRCSR